MKDMEEECTNPAFASVNVLMLDLVSKEIKAIREEMNHKIDAFIEEQKSRIKAAIDEAISAGPEKDLVVQHETRIQGLEDWAAVEPPVKQPYKRVD